MGGGGEKCALESVSTHVTELNACRVYSTLVWIAGYLEGTLLISYMNMNNWVVLLCSVPLSP